MREQEVVTLAVVAVAADIRAGVWQFPVASSHLAEVQMRKRNNNSKKKRKAGVWMLPGGGQGIRSVSGKPAPVFSMSAPTET